MGEHPEQQPEQRVTLGDAYALVTPADNRELYARWATTYEADFVQDTLYVIPDRVAEIFAEVASHLAGGPRADRALLDVGCGTGLVAAALVRDTADSPSGNDWVIDGVDLSPQMLAESARKRRDDGTPVYRELFEADLTEPITARAGQYAGLLSAGTFTHGHLGPEALSGLIVFGRPGAIFTIGINAEHYRSKGFDEQLARDVADGRITGLEPRVVEMYLPGSSHHGDTAVVVVFRVA